jgi:hypothetical protein
VPEGVPSLPVEAGGFLWAAGGSRRASGGLDGPMARLTVRYAPRQSGSSRSLGRRRRVEGSPEAVAHSAVALHAVWW